TAASESYTLSLHDALPISRQVEEEFRHILTLGTDFPQAEYDRIAGYFTPPPFEGGLPDEIDRSDPDFAVWVDQQVAPHKAPGYADRKSTRLNSSHVKISYA